MDAARSITGTRLVVGACNACARSSRMARNMRVNMCSRASHNNGKIIAIPAAIGAG
jgi:hypothetical protein